MYKKFDELFIDETKYGTKIKTDKYLSEGKYPIVDQGQKKISGYADIEEGIFKEVPAIIFGDHTRLIKYIDVPFFIGADGVKIIRSRLKKVNYKYLYYALLNVHIPNTGYNRHFKWLKETKIFYPDSEKQKHIVEVLDKISLIIEKKNKQIEQCDFLLKSLFIEMFGDPIKNEKDWRINKFRDICTVRQGLQIPISKRLLYKEDNCYEYITVAYLHGSKEREYIKNPKETVICNKEDILMTRTGNTGMVITGVHGVFHNNFFLIDFDRYKFDKCFLVEYLNLELIQLDIMRRAGSSTIPDLNHDEFYKINVYVPPLDLQKRFAEYVSSIDKSKLAVKKSLEELEILKKSLMQKYFA